MFVAVRKAKAKGTKFRGAQSRLLKSCPKGIERSRLAMGGWLAKRGKLFNMGSLWFAGNGWAEDPRASGMECSSPFGQMQRVECKLSRHSGGAFAMIPGCIGGWNLPLFGRFPYNQALSYPLISIFHRCLVEPRNPAPALR